MADYATKVLTDHVAWRSFEDLVEPIRADFAASGLSNEEIIELGQRAIAEVRHERGMNKR